MFPWARVLGYICSSHFRSTSLSLSITHRNASIRIHTSLFSGRELVDLISLNLSRGFRRELLLHTHTEKTHTLSSWKLYLAHARSRCSWNVKFHEEASSDGKSPPLRNYTKAAKWEDGNRKILKWTVLQTRSRNFSNILSSYLFRTNFVPFLSRIVHFTGNRVIFADSNSYIRLPLRIGRFYWIQLEHFYTARKYSLDQSVNTCEIICNVKKYLSLWLTLP